MSKTTDRITINGQDYLTQDSNLIKYAVPSYFVDGTNGQSVWVDADFAKGTTIELTNKSNGNVTVGWYKSNKSDRTQSNTSLSAKQTQTVTVGDNGLAYILFYFTGDGTVIYSDLDHGVYKRIADVEDAVETELNTFVYECNLLDSATVLQNKNLNYDTGAINDGGSKTLYQFAVKPGTTYFFTQLSSVYMYICLYKEDMTFIDNMYHYHNDQGAWDSEWSVPDNCYYIVAWVDSDYASTAFWGLKADYPKWGEGFSKTLNSEIYMPDGNEKIVVIGSGEDADFSTVKEGFSYAVANGMKVLIQPGTYDLIAEGATGEGLVLPKEVWGYGATLICKPSSKNWTISAVNVDRNGTGTKVYGLRIECENCRYCIHDEMGYSTTDYYHNVFKDLTLIHESEPDETLIYPQAIGGGLGDGGFVEIENVVCDTAAQRCISYHSYAHNDGQGQPIPQTKPCTIIIKDSYFSGNVHGTSSGTWTTVKNTMYVSNCSIGDAISYGEGYNMIVKGWNNVQRN